MNAIEATDPVEPGDDEFPATPIAQSDPGIYLPGTPTVSFLEYVEIAVRMLRR